MSYIYILETSDTAKMEYRVAPVPDPTLLEYMGWTHDGINPNELRRAFGKSKVFPTHKAALAKAALRNESNEIRTLKLYYDWGYYMEQIDPEYDRTNGYGTLDGEDNENG